MPSGHSWALAAIPGVILAQYLRGFARACESQISVDASLLAGMLVAASEAAYSAVETPVEGTILTVARAAGQAAMEASSTR